MNSVLSVASLASATAVAAQPFGNEGRSKTLGMIADRSFSLSEDDHVFALIEDHKRAEDELDRVVVALSHAHDEFAKLAATLSSSEKRVLHRKLLGKLKRQVNAAQAIEQAAVDALIARPAETLLGIVAILDHALRRQGASGEIFRGPHDITKFLNTTASAAGTIFHCGEFSSRSA
jgi:hypothetical protein